MCRILAVSDSVDPALYDHFNAERWREEKIDVIISCGDLPPYYLSYLVSRFDVPLYYVKGNHDEKYREEPPEGGESIDGKLVTIDGLRVLGLGGAPRYNSGENQYTDSAMNWRITCLKPRMWLSHGIDLLVTHAPPQYCPLAHQVCPTPAGFGRPCIRPARSSRETCYDASDRAHRGFPALTEMIHTYHPRVLLHGHTHLNYGRAKRLVEVDGTRVVDVHGYYLLEI